MPVSIDTPTKRLVLAVAAAVALALAAALAFDAVERGRRPPPAPPAPPAVTRVPPAPGAARPQAVLGLVVVRPHGAPGEAPDRDDASTDAVVVEPPAEGDGATRAEPPGGEMAAEQAFPPDAAPPARPAAPVEAGRRAATAAPRGDVARRNDTTSDAGLARRLNRDAIGLIDAGRPRQAIALLEQAASLQPRDAEILGNLGYAYMRVGDNEAASQSLRRSLAFAPNRSATWINLGQTYAELGERDLAVDAVVIGYRYSTRKASVRAALLAAASDPGYSPQWHEAAGMALDRIGDG